MHSSTGNGFFFMSKCAYFEGINVQNEKELASDQLKGDRINAKCDKNQRQATIFACVRCNPCHVHFLQDQRIQIIVIEMGEGTTKTKMQYANLLLKRIKSCDA